LNTEASKAKPWKRQFNIFLCIAKRFFKTSSYFLLNEMSQICVETKLQIRQLDR
jgi:hypothetical protein